MFLSYFSFFFFLLFSKTWRKSIIDNLSHVFFSNVISTALNTSSRESSNDSCFLFPFFNGTFPRNDCHCQSVEFTNQIGLTLWFCGCSLPAASQLRSNLIEISRCALSVLPVLKIPRSSIESARIRVSLGYESRFTRLRAAFIKPVTGSLLHGRTCRPCPT